MNVDKPTSAGLSTRERLLQAALTCFSRKGYHQTTSDEIVAESGLGKGTLYRHFENKRDLFISLVQWMMSGIGEDITLVSTKQQPVPERLRENKIYTKAIVHYKALLKYKPRDPQIHYEIGQLYMLKGDYDSAYREFITVLNLDPRNAMARRALSELKLKR